MLVVPSFCQLGVFDVERDRALLLEGEGEARRRPEQRGAGARTPVGVLRARLSPARGRPAERARVGGERAREHERGRAEAAAAAAEAAAPKTALAGGVTLTSVSFTLPTSDREYPAGPHSDAINGNCLSCHSAGMVLTQPELSRAEWQGEVNKMVKVYKAPVSPEDAAAVVEYLAQLKPGR